MRHDPFAEASSQAGYASTSGRDHNSSNHSSGLAPKHLIRQNSTAASDERDAPMCSLTSGTSTARVAVPGTGAKGTASDAVEGVAVWIIKLLGRHNLAPPDASLQLKVAADIRRAAERFATAAIRGAALGATLKGGLHLLAFAMYLLSHLKLRHTASGPRRLAGHQHARTHAEALPIPLPLPASPLPTKRRVETLGGALADTARYSSFLGSMGGVYVAVDEALAVVFGRKRSSKWRALVAGACAGQTLAITGRSTRHWSLATYVMLRGLVLLVRCGNKAEAGSLLRRLLAPTRLKHGDTALMCIAASQICYSFIMLPSTLTASYVKFLMRQGAKDPYVWAAVREQAQRHARGLPPGPVAALHGTPFASHRGALPCAYYHPGSSCLGHAVGILPHAYFRSLGVYCPVYLVPAVLVHRRRLLQKEGALAILPKVAVGVARSSLFLSIFIAAAFGSACIGFHGAGATTGLGIAATVWLGGLATLLEKKSRRMELALYCLSRALESFARCLHEWGFVRKEHWPARMDIMMFSVGCAAIAHCYSGDSGRHRDVFRTKYLSVLDAVFGNKGLTTGCIQHAPTNKELLITMRSTIHSYSWHVLHELERIPPSRLKRLSKLSQPDVGAGSVASAPAATMGRSASGTSSGDLALAALRADSANSAAADSPLHGWRMFGGTSQPHRSTSARSSISFRRHESDPGPFPAYEHSAGERVHRGFMFAADDAPDLSPFALQPHPPLPTTAAASRTPLKQGSSVPLPWLSGGSSGSAPVGHDHSVLDGLASGAAALGANTAPSGRPLAVLSPLWLASLATEDDDSAAQ